MPDEGRLEENCAKQVAATFGRNGVKPDGGWVSEFAASLRASHTPDELVCLFGRFRGGEGRFDVLMRRVILGALCRRVGNGLEVGPEVVFKHAETLEFGDAVFLGAHTMIQGRFDGTCRIGNHVWIGPHSYLDARDLVIEDYVGWGPGAKLLGSTHSGQPADIPIIATDLIIKPVVVGYGADIGTNATILPGVRIGAHAIVGAGAVVTADVPDYAVAAGVPARVLRSRREAEV